MNWKMDPYHKYQKETGEFIFAQDILKKADVIFVPGNGYPHMAEKAARLYRDGYAPYVLPSGRFSVTAGHFAGVLEKEDRYCGNYVTEWEFLKDVLVQNKVPEEAVLCEDQATFTYENAIFSRQVTDRAGIEVKTAILCCKNYHARRAKMYYELLYPEAEILVCPVQVDSVTKENWMETEEGIDAVIGEVSRIMKQFSLMLGIGSQSE